MHILYGQSGLIPVKDLTWESESPVCCLIMDLINQLAISAYMVFVRDTIPDMSADFNVQNESNFQFLNKFKDCFSDALLEQLPPERPEDHMIDLVPGSEPPNRPPYRVSAT